MRFCGAGGGTKRWQIDIVERAGGHQSIHRDPIKHKPRGRRCAGVVTLDQSQMIFVDTPGIFKPKRRLDRAMVHSAWSGAADADVLALIVDCKRGMTDEIEALIEGLSDYKQSKVLILNKIDQVERTTLLALAQQLNDKLNFEQTFMVSALKGDGVKDFVDYCAQAVPIEPWHFPEDHLTDLTLALTAAEVTREKLFLRIHEEIPYAATVETEQFKTQKDGSYRIQQVIYVPVTGIKRLCWAKMAKRSKRLVRNHAKS